MKKIFIEGNQIHNFMSSSGSGTVINYGSGSDFLTSYGSGSTSQKYGSYGSGSTTLLPNPLHLSPVGKPDRRHTGRLKTRDNLLTRGGGRGGAKLYDRKKPVPLSVTEYYVFMINRSQLQISQL